MQSIKQELNYGSWSMESSLPEVMSSTLQSDELNNYSLIKQLKTDNLISLLSTTIPNQRTEKQCKSIAQLLRYQPYFINISKNQKVLLQLSSWVEYRKVKENQFIYRIGQPSDCLYVLLKGDVCLTAPQKIIIQVKEPEPQPQEEYHSTRKIESQREDHLRQTRRNLTQTTMPTPLHSPPMLSKKISAGHQIHLQPVLKKRISKKLSINQNFITAPVAIRLPKPKIQIETRVVRVVYEGQGFGDLGEIFKRGTNAQAKQSSHLIIIRKQHFDYLSAVQLKSQSKIKYEFLSSLPFFDLLYKYSLESIIYFVQEKKVIYNAVVFNENDPIQYVYIVYRGQFKLLRKVMSKKEEPSRRNSHLSLEIYPTKAPQKNVCFKSVGPGEMLGYIQSYTKNNQFAESCICKSQQGVLIRIDKNKFLKKIRSPDNNLDQITKYVEQKAEQKKKELDLFVNRQENDQLYIRYLHTPTSRSRRIKTQMSSQRQSSIRQDELRKLSTSSNNFFNEFNQTVIHHPKTKRISINRNERLQLAPELIPNSVKDIVQMVKHETNYHKIRKPDKNVTLFEFNISKVPIHVKKKFGFLNKKGKK